MNSPAEGASEVGNMLSVVTAMKSKSLMKDSFLFTVVGGEKSSVLQQGEGRNVAVCSPRSGLFTSCSPLAGRCHTSVASSTQPCVGFLVCLSVCT